MRYGVTIMKNTFLMLSFYITFVCAAVVFCASSASAKLEPAPVETPAEKPADETPDETVEKPPEEPVKGGCGGGVEGDVAVECGMG